MSIGAIYDVHTEGRYTYVGRGGDQLHVDVHKKN